MKGGLGIICVVSFFSCSCPSTNECYHIVAAKMFWGMTVPCKSVKQNLSQLRKNSIKRREKRVVGKDHVQMMIQKVFFPH